MNLPTQLQIGGKLLNANLKQAWRDKTDWITACMFAITALLYIPLRLTSLLV